MFTTDIATLRTPRIFGFVIFDWAATLAGTWVLSEILGINYNILLVILLILSVFLHMYFNIPTNTNYYLGLSGMPKK
jgi:hypothetical protein